VFGQGLSDARVHSSRFQVGSELRIDGLGVPFFHPGLQVFQLLRIEFSDRKLYLL
jgi:hypothetical protein